MNWIKLRYWMTSVWTVFNSWYWTSLAKGNLPDWCPRWFDVFSFEVCSSVLATAETIATATDEQRAAILAPRVQAALEMAAGITVDAKVATLAAANLVRSWQGLQVSPINLALVPVPPTVEPPTHPQPDPSQQ